MKSAPNLPKRSTLLAILVLALVVFALAEHRSFFVITEMTRDQRALANRWGVFLGYLGAVVGAGFVFWDFLASHREQQASAAIATLYSQIELLQALEAEAPRGLALLISRNKSEMEVHARLQEDAQRYQREKSWIGWLCLAFIIGGTVCQLIGGSDGG